jgi:methionyl-tRNA synthetase
LNGKERYMVTSALPYANGPIHLGHLAGAYLPADIFVRYCRLKKRDVVYICGSDEHGVPILLRARSENTSPQEIVDRYHAMIKKSFAAFGMSFDYYGRTSAKIHHETSQDFFIKLAQKNIFELKTEKQLFDPEANMFLADRFVRGTCPVCGYEDAYGDQCEKCGSSLSPSDLKNPRSAITNAKPVLKETTHWYLPLEKFQPRLEEWIGRHPEWRPNVLGQIKSWFKEGLKNRAVTRDLPWGVPIPAEVAEKASVDASGKVLYVWFDAPIGYISATREWAIAKGKPDLWKEYWQGENSKLFHFIGKDNIVFHCLIFPAMLMAHGDYVLPENVPANEFLNLEGNKLSTSRNYAVWLDDFLKKFEADSLRYSLTMNLPETRDADFSWKEFQARHNNELADILGNFINRTFTFVDKYFDGKIPEAGDYDEMDKELMNKLGVARDEVGKAIDNFQFKESLKRTMDFCRFANKYFNDKEPWNTRVADPTKCAVTLNLCAQVASSMAILINPILPFTSQRIWNIIDLPGEVDDASWGSIGDTPLKSGHLIGDLEILFTKIDDSVIQEEVERLRNVQLQMEKEKDNILEDLISIEEFKKVELRTAKVLEAENIPKADKLLKLKINLGDEERQLVAGIAQHYAPQELIGKTIIVVTNLQPATIRGVESQGMLLAVEDGDRLTLLTTEKEAVPGKRVS